MKILKYQTTLNIPHALLQRSVNMPKILDKTDNQNSPHINEEEKRTQKTNSNPASISNETRQNQIQTT